MDDEPETARLYTMNLVARGYESFTARSVGEALQILEERPVDLVLLDLVLPDSRGADTCQKIREACAAPIIVVSGRAEDSYREQALLAGADGYLVKPFVISVLLAEIRAALGCSQGASAQKDE